MSELPMDIVRERRKAKFRKGVVPYLFVLPAMAVLLLFKVGPILVSSYGSLFQTGARNRTFFVGLENYLNLFSDSIFYKSLGNTLIFNVFCTPIQIVLAFFLALIFNQSLKGIKVFRTIFYMPVCISLSMATMVWALMMNPYNGLLNSFLGIFGIANQPFLTSAEQAMACVILIATWKGTPYWMMFLLAGMQSIPQSVVEATYIDGCKGWQRTLYVTIPMMKSSFGFVTVSNTIANMLLFVPMYVQTKGGPMNSTNVLMYEAYKSAYSYSNMGRSYAIVVLLLLVCIGIVALQNKFLKVTE